MDTSRILDQFILFLQNQGKSQSTLVAYKKDISQLFEYLDKQSLNLIDLKSTNIESYMDYLKSTGEFTLKTISRKLNSIKTFFRYLSSQKLIVSNPTELVKHPNLNLQPPRILTPLEYRALRDIARSNLRLYTMVELMLQTGITIGELSRIRREDIHLKDNEKYLYISGFSSKTSRKVELNEVISFALEIYLEKYKFKPTDSEYAFITKTGRPIMIRNIRSIIDNAFKKAGISNATVNDIRNTFIAFQIAGGMELEKLAKVVGHQKATTTERYLTLVQDRLQKVNNKIKSL
jgi:site-specific recombinase XerD